LRLWLGYDWKRDQEMEYTIFRLVKSHLKLNIDHDYLVWPSVPDDVIHYVTKL